jgi:hypothetical protein
MIKNKRDPCISLASIKELEAELRKRRAELDPHEVANIIYDKYTDKINESRKKSDVIEEIATVKLTGIVDCGAIEVDLNDSQTKKNIEKILAKKQEYLEEYEQLVLRLLKEEERNFGCDFSTNPKFEEQYLEAMFDVSSIY